MTLMHARDDKVLRRRVQRFLSTPMCGGGAVGHVLAPLEQLGQVLIFGGAVRDLALRGSSALPNDIDVVVRTDSGEQLADFMRAMRAVQNRFGGYRFVADGWKFDVWLFEDTWAFRAGLVAATDVDDLLKTTFFDWDAIAYDVSRHRVLARTSYFETLAQRVVDINLIENPNPYGVAIRALRIFSSGRARISARLARYVLSVVPESGSTADSLGDRGAQPRSAWLECATRELATRLASSEHEPVGLDSEQLRLA